MNILVAIALLLQDPKAPEEVFKDVSASVVAVRGLAVGGERSGAGVVISQDGLILTSYSIIPKGAEQVRVWMYGARLYTAEVVAVSQADELALIRIKTDKELKPITFGVSKDVRIGDAAYAVGNAHNSFINDDSPSFSLGIVSGYYNLTDVRSNATYLGEVFETTAAVNFGMEGAPLLDKDGRMIGLVTLNYSANRWLGNAIPIDWVSSVVEKMKKTAGLAANGGPVEIGEGTLGLEVETKDGKVVVKSVVRDGPADLAGLTVGAVILRVGSLDMKAASDFEKIARRVQPDAILNLTVEIGGEKTQVKLSAVKK